MQALPTIANSMVVKAFTMMQKTQVQCLFYLFGSRHLNLGFSHQVSALPKTNFPPGPETTSQWKACWNRYVSKKSFDESAFSNRKNICQKIPNQLYFLLSNVQVKYIQQGELLRPVTYKGYNLIICRTVWTLKSKYCKCLTAGELRPWTRTSQEEWSEGAIKQM